MTYDQKCPSCDCWRWRSTLITYKGTARCKSCIVEFIAELEQESVEQARLNGMGSEREARLQARIAELEEIVSGKTMHDAYAEGYRQGLDVVARLDIPLSECADDLHPCSAWVLAVAEYRSAIRKLIEEC